MLRLWLAIVAAFVAGSFGCTRGEPTIGVVTVHPTNPQIIYIYTNKGLFKTRDGGSTWDPINEGLESSQIRSLAIDPTATSTVYAGTFANAIFKSSDGGQRWHPINIGMKEHVSVVNSLVFYPPRPEEVYAGTTVGVYRSRNGGQSWEETVEGMESVYVVPIAFDPNSPEVLYAGTSGGMYRSDDRGEHWKIINQGLIEGHVGTAMSLGVNAISINRKDSSHLIIATTRGLFGSDDHGATWEPRAELTGPSFMEALARDPENPDRIYAGGSNGLFISPDDGRTWTAVAGDPVPETVRALAADPSRPGVIYAGTKSGLMKSVDHGATWERIPIRQ